MAEQRETSAASDIPRSELVARVFVRFQRSLLRYLRDLLARREDAEDVAQETYLKLMGAASLEQVFVLTDSLVGQVSGLLIGEELLDGVV